ncbi:SMI1/KNR4 family protein [Chitinophaga sp. GCM10012297]|uniref:SMI1/KNR4 family protein n=1 Tax=Chitinophaga chungangae TaxID=2821488 RepID=A0ABS3YDK2_9BACT|nr:SMI1/KNR4 family protein [Chitinophaga chungangae]MBO9152393.1 SMI1/KNR4 family protein [Chitinophaga chungangae]
MKPLEQLKAMLGKTYENEDGEEYSIELQPGLSDEEINALRQRLPGNFIPAEIEELLRFAGGFEFYAMEEGRFDSLEFGMEDLFPHAIQLCGDGFGNFWIVDINASGEWGPVYYVCHDPAVLVKHSNNLAEFIAHLDEYGRLLEKSHLDQVHEKIVFDIWETKNGIMEQYEKDPGFPPEFIRTLPKLFMIADLTNAPNGAGFAWGKYGPNTRIIRFEDKPVWVVEKKVKQGFLHWLFHRQK